MDTKDFTGREKEYSETKVWTSLVLWGALSSEGSQIGCAGSRGGGLCDGGPAAPWRDLDTLRGAQTSFCGQ